MVHKRLVAQAEGVVMSDIRKPCEWRAGTWSPALHDEHDFLCLYRFGARRRSAGGVEEHIDPTGAYIGRAGVEARLSGAGEGVYSFIRLSPEAYDRYVAPVAPAGGWLLRPDSAFEYLHRRLLAHARRGMDAFEASESLVVLLGALPPRIERHSRPPRGETHHRLLVAEVQELLAARPVSGIDELARAVASSPSHLSRVFHRITGKTISAYRNDLRVRTVLHRIAEGADDLSGLAMEFGFADHAHLTRTVKRHLGRTPSALRAELKPGKA